MKVIATPLEFIPAHPFEGFLKRLNELIQSREVELVLVGMPRNMDGSYGPAAQKVEEFLVALNQAIRVPTKPWDERLTSAQPNRFLIAADVRRSKRKEQVVQTAAPILWQSYLNIFG